MRQHPLHPAFVHFPIALLSTTSLWDVAAWVTDDERWWFVAFVQCALGLACALPAATTGLLDLRKIAPDGPDLPPAKILAAREDFLEGSRSASEASEGREGTERPLLGAEGRASEASEGRGGTERPLLGAEGRARDSTANRHMASVALALVAYGASLWLRGGTAPPAGADRLAAVACGGLGFLALAAAGWYGAELVYRFGVGRASEEPRTSERRERVGQSARSAAPANELATHPERARLAP